MDILQPGQKSALFDFLRSIKYELPEWLFVEVRLLDGVPERMPGSKVAALMQAMYPKHVGFIYICSRSEILMLIRWGREHTPEALSRDVRAKLPEDLCEIEVAPSTIQGLARLQLKLFPPAVRPEQLYAARKNRAANVFLVADDDTFQRAIMRRLLEPFGAVHEASDGTAIAPLYRKHNPDIVFLDIHMPGRDGREVVYDLTILDTEAYVIMASADTAEENITDTRNKGARGFLAKPYGKARLLECVQKCPTVALRKF